MCILKLALYGHPDAGGYWERHCEEHLTSIGSVPVPDWRSTYWHPELKLCLMVYVDDFRMSGPSANFANGWSMIRQIKTDEPHAVSTLRPFFEQCVDSYLTLAKKDISIPKPAKTPFLDD